MFVPLGRYRILIDRQGISERSLIFWRTTPHRSKPLRTVRRK